MPVVNEIKYPDTPAEMANYKDKTFVKMFNEFSGSQSTSNDKAFAREAGKATAKTSHDVFEKSGLHSGKCQITLSKRDQSKIKSLIGSRGYLAVDVKKMLKIVQEIYGMMYNEVQVIALEKFYKGPTFTEYHRKSVYDSIKPNKQMAEKLQISDMKGLKNFQFHLSMGEDAAAEKLFNTLSKAEELKKKAPAIVKKLMAQNSRFTA